MAEQSGLRVVVTGATGNVGTSLLRALGEDPRIGSILGIARRVPEWTPAKTEWASADLGAGGARDADLTALFQGADAVVHLAWLLQPTHAPLTMWRTNTLGTDRVLRAMATAGVPALVYASSVAAYSPGPRGPGERAVDESWPTHGWPTAAYSREKAYVERLLDGFERDHPGIRVVRMRPGFIFKRQSAMEQRRLFAGPLVPHRLVRPGLLPAVPDIPGLRFQALHTDDAADAYRQAVVRPVEGAFNLAADPPIDVHVLADLLKSRVVPVPPAALRATLAAAWRLHLVPASPNLFDALLRLPLLDTHRARQQLEWTPRWSGPQAVAEFLSGLRQGAGMDTPPLASRVPGGRIREIATGIGSRP
ncbi:NAD-dependent epimerase/dehydratase family protein [Streptomyces gobiensis]|uniref:NAD-dependent epimerase/dehydratase family protein n=1 Tax=Streptomyces gobiensis TaxID=2875706 RepID=UPI001E2A9C66|nr:NAD-dependent epimerase/dehydratase family protein [Streptomyces gobiensis]UGY94546.1 NAD-dependent epimerase/dehydratase family protein [Streptomyces gobiensis]